MDKKTKKRILKLTRNEVIVEMMDEKIVENIFNKIDREDYITHPFNGRRVKSEMIISDDDNLNDITMSHADRINLDYEIDDLLFYGVKPMVDELHAAKERKENVYFEIEGHRYRSGELPGYYLDSPAVRFYAATVTEDGAEDAIIKYQERDKEVQKDIVWHDFLVTKLLGNDKENLDNKNKSNKQQGDDGITM